MCDQQMLRPACAYAQSYQSICLSIEYSMTLRQLTEHHLEFLGLKCGCRGSCQNATLLEITCHGSIVLVCSCYVVVSVSLPGCSMGWPVYTSPGGKIWLLCFNCVLNCVLAVMRLSVFCVSSWLFNGLACAHISMWKELVALF